MLALGMPMQVRPSQTSRVTVRIRTIVPQQQNRILEDLIVFVLNPKIVVLPREVVANELVEILRRVIRENHIVGFRLDRES